MRRLLYCLLLISGAVLVFLGTRDLLESYFGQTEAARNYPPAVAAPQAPAIRIGNTVAKLSIPRLNAQLYVMEGDDDEQLRRGPGHLPGTALPGVRGNSVIVGHRDTHFRILKNIREGDDIVIDRNAHEFHYRVQQISIVDPSNTASLKPSGDAELHLITCYPFYYAGAAPKRFVVEARLAGPAARVK